MCCGDAEQGFDMSNLLHNIQDLLRWEPIYTHDGGYSRFSEKI
jgi:hypothetical protein